MKKPLTIGFFLLYIATAYSQRVDLDRFSYTASYRSFPEEQLPAEYKTFNIRFEAASSLGLGYAIQNLGNSINIEGFKKVPGTGHFTVLVMLDDIVTDKPENRQRTETKKDRQGVETSKTYFSLAMNYSFSARASVYDYKGNTLLSNYILFDRESKREYKSAEFSSTEEATGYYSNKLPEIKSQLAKQLVNTVINNLSDMLNRHYGYPTKRENDILWILNNKKHPEYAEHQKAWNTFKNAIVQMSPDEPVDNIRKSLQPVIDYYEKIKTRYTSSDKEGRKLRYASYFNLAKIYLLLDDPAAAMKEADALAMNDWDEQDGRNLRVTAQALDLQLKRNNSRTRHFAFNIDRFEPPVK